MRNTAHRVILVAALCSCAVLLATGSARPAGAAGATAPQGRAPAISAAPLNEAFLPSLLGPPIGEQSGASVGNALGDRPGPQDFSHAIGAHVTGVRDFGPLPAAYDLRTFGRVTSVKNQNPRGTCWAFASCGSLESGLLPGATWDFSEDNMVLQSGFDTGGDPYDHGGNVDMSTAYLIRWGGPVTESQDGYNDGVTPPGLTPSKHVQEVDWIPARGSALDNDGIKNAVMQYGGAYVSMGWYDSAYNSTTKSYYYNGSSGTNHGVLIVGWDDDYAAANFLATPPGNGAFLVKNSWGTGWGSGGYFYASYHDTKFGRSGVMAVFNAAESTGNYAGIYQYDPLGNVGSLGYGTTTAWFANVFTAQATASLSAVGFYTVTPGSSYEVYTGSSLATKTLSTSGTQAYMGYHTVTLPTPVAVTNGQPFVVAVKMTSPDYKWPIPVEYPVAGYSSAATAASGQSYISSNGTSWSDLTAWDANANACLKAYVRTAVTPAPTVVGFAPTAGQVGASVNLIGTDFTGATALTFNGTAATSFTVGSATQITATVPAGATTGPIAVTTPGGTGVSTAGFTVDAPQLSITVTAPTGTTSKAQGSALPVTWTTNANVAGGQFSLWVVSPGNGWYVGKIHAADGTASYADSVDLGVPVANGYRVFVYYRATPSDPWGIYGMSPGTVDVTAS